MTTLRYRIVQFRSRSRFFWPVRWVQQNIFLRTNITAEDQLFFSDVNFDKCGTNNMTIGMVTNFDIVPKINPFICFDFIE